jgi:hypothetical protein
MTDIPTTTTEGVVLTKNHRIKAFNWLYGLVGDEGHERVSILEEYVSGLEEGIETLTTTQLEMAVERLRGEVEILREALVHIRSIDTMEFGAVATKLLNALEREMQGETKGGHAVTTLTNADLAAIRERAEQATKGPWLADTAGHLEIYSQHEDEPALIFIFDWIPDKGIEIDAYGHLQERHPDLEFIAHARTDVPALLDTIETLREVLAWYAEEDNSDFEIFDHKTPDLGSRARAVLARMEGE